MTDLKAALEQMIEMSEALGRKAIPEKYVLLKGRAYEGVGRARRMGPIKQCFENSFNMVVKARDLRYVEGFVVFTSFPLPIHHAWVELPDGSAVDPTLRKPADYSYYGVSYDRDTMVREVVRLGIFGLHLDSREMYNVAFLYRQAPELERWFAEPCKRHPLFEKVRPCAP